jgi:uncharacterized protein YndB with AHSA1/START domain
MKETLRFEAFYPHPAEKVWRALTETEALRQWLGRTDFRPLIGFRFRVEEIDCKVLELQPHKLLRLAWDDGEAGSASLVTWRLSPREGGTHVVLEHESPFEAEPYVLIEASPNWRTAVARLGAHIDRVPPIPVVYDEDTPPALARAGFRQEELCQAR